MKVVLIFIFTFQYALGASYYYVTTPYLHLHAEKKLMSPSLTGLSCGHGVRVIKEDKKNSWIYVKAAGKNGYLPKKYLSRSKPKCLKTIYQKFFDKLELDLTDQYYWGRLYDQYITGNTFVR